MNNKQYESVCNLKAYLVDTSTRTLYYVPIIGCWEKFVAGFDNLELLKSRAMAVGVNLIAGRLQGKIRELVGLLTHTNENSSDKRKRGADIFSGLITGATTYAGVLYFADVSIKEALEAIPFAVGFTTLTGRSYGKFNDKYRKKFGLTPVFDKVKPEAGR